MKKRFFPAFFIIMTLIPSLLQAHGTDFKIIENDPVVALEFFYSDHAPMAYAEVLVFGPENSDIEYQNGRTDQEGRFSFYPKVPGAWVIEVNDGMGHAVHADVEVSPDISARLPESSSSALFAGSRSIKVGFGISILINIFMVVGLLKKRDPF